MRSPRPGQARVDLPIAVGAPRRSRARRGGRPRTSRRGIVQKARRWSAPSSARSDRSITRRFDRLARAVVSTRHGSCSPCATRAPACRRPARQSPARGARTAHHVRAGRPDGLTRSSCAGRLAPRAPRTASALAAGAVRLGIRRCRYVRRKARAELRPSPAGRRRGGHSVAARRRGGQGERAARTRARARPCVGALNRDPLRFVLSREKFTDGAFTMTANTPHDGTDPRGRTRAESRSDRLYPRALCRLPFPAVASPVVTRVALRPSRTAPRRHTFTAASVSRLIHEGSFRTV